MKSTVLRQMLCESAQLYKRRAVLRQREGLFALARCLWRKVREIRRELRTMKEPPEG